jgi:hypothetical protein
LVIVGVEVIVGVSVGVEVTQLTEAITGGRLSTVAGEEAVMEAMMVTKLLRQEVTSRK